MKRKLAKRAGALSLVGIGVIAGAVCSRTMSERAVEAQSSPTRALAERLRTAPAVLADIRKTYGAPLALATDYVVFNANPG